MTTKKTEEVKEVKKAKKQDPLRVTLPVWDVNKEESAGKKTFTTAEIETIGSHHQIIRKGAPNQVEKWCFIFVKTGKRYIIEKMTEEQVHDAIKEAGGRLRDAND